MRIRLIPALLGVLVACTNTPTTPSPPPPPSPPPGALTISSSTPANNASGIAVDANITVTFSKPMKTASVTSTLSPTADLGAGVWSSGDTTLTLDPTVNLAPGTAYTLTLEGKDKSDKALEGSKTIAFTTASATDPAPATPANPSAKPGDTSVTVSWDANTEADLKGYTVFWGVSSSALIYSSVVDKTQTSKTITGLTNGTPYFFAVSAEDTARNASAKTAPLSATPVKPSSGDTTPPAVPTDLDASNSNSDLILSWKSNTEPDLKGYNIYLGTTPQTLTLAGFADKTLKNKKFTGLTIGTTYYFAMDAEDTSGNKSTRSALVNATPKDNVAPTLVSSTPANGATRVRLEDDIVFRFSEPMARDSLKFECTANGQPTCARFVLDTLSRAVWSGGDRTMTFTPNLATAGAATPVARPAPQAVFGETYTISITARDRAGNALPDGTKITFTFVPEPPKLVSSTPANGAVNVPVNTDLVLKFSEPMRTDSLELGPICVASGPCVLFKPPAWSDGDKTATLKSAILLEGNKDFTLTLGAKDKAGNALVPTSIRFTTIGPKLVSSAPANGATNVDVTLASISFNFNEPIQENSLQLNCTFAANNASTQCGAQGSGFFDTPTWSNDDKTATLARKGGAFVPKTSYRVEIIAAQDKAGSALADTSISFTTAGPPPALVSIFPENGARGELPEVGISVVFSKSMNADSLKRAFNGTIRSENGLRPLALSSITPFQDPNGFGYIFQPQAPLDYNAVVDWGLTTDATDAAGNHLPQPLQSTFSVLRQLTVTISAGANTGYVVQACAGLCNNIIGTDQVVVGSRFRSDDHTDTFRGFLGFEHLSVFLSPSTDTSIVSASLNLKLLQKTVNGDPFNPNNLGPLMLERVDHGAALEGSDFDATVLSCGGMPCAIGFPSPDAASGSIDVTTFVQADWLERAARGDAARFRMRFPNTPAKSGTNQAVLLYDVHPTLTITYLTP